MRLLFAVALIVTSFAPVAAAEPYRFTPYFECLVGKGVAERIWNDAGADEAMEFALANCASADPGKPPADQDAVDSREYMRIVAYDVIARAEAFEKHASVPASPADRIPLEIGFGN